MSDAALPLEKITYSVEEACAATSLGTTKLYELLTAGKLEAKVDGRRTMITRASLQRYIDERARPKPIIQAEVIPWPRRVIAPEANRSGFIYFARFGDAGPIKIGFAVNVLRRIYQIQNASPELITLICSTPGCLQEEADLHFRFRSDRLRGEWFRPAPELLKYIAEVSAP